MWRPVAKNYYLGNSSTMDEIEKIEALQVMLENLSERERDVIQQTFGIDLADDGALKTLAENFDGTMERIVDIEKRAMAKIRNEPTNSDDK